MSEMESLCSTAEEAHPMATQCTHPVQTPRVLSPLCSAVQLLLLSPSPPSTSAAAAAATSDSRPPPLRSRLLKLSPALGSMKRLLRRLSRVAAADACAAAGAYQPLRAPAKEAAAAPTLSGARRLGACARVPCGHVPVCVGEEGGPVERYAVRAELLGRPPFAALLRRAAQEYGYAHPGALRIPCPVADFRALLLQLSSSSSAGDDDDDDAALCSYC